MTGFRKNLGSFGKRGALALALGTTAMAGFGSAAHAVTYVWSSGNYMPGTTSPNPLMSPDVLAIQTASSKFFLTSFTNQSGLIDWSGGPIYLGNGAILDNQSLFEASGDLSFGPTSGSGSFLNSGIFRKTGGAGSLTIGAVAVTNSGTIDAQSGSILFNGGNANFLAGSTFMGAGNVVIGNNAAFHGGFTSSNLQFTGGSFSGDNAVLTGTMAWQGGTFSGDWTIDAGSVMNSTGAPSRFVNGGTFTNEGTVNWSGTGGLFFQGGANFVNENLFDITSSMSIAPSSGSGTFTNAAGATLRVSNGNIVQISSNFEDLGGMIVANGVFNFSAGGQSFDGTTFTGSGTSNINANSTFSNAIYSDNLDFNNGSFTGVSAALTGVADWNAGTFTGNWTIESGATLNGLGAANRFINTGTMTNDGTVAWSGTGGLYFQGGGSLVNNGDFDVAESMLIGNSSGAGTFYNEATGTMSVVAGKTFTVQSGFVNNGGTITADGTFMFNGSGASFNSGTTFNGLGTNLVSGNATFTGTINTTNLDLASATFTGVGAVVNGSMDWLSGTIFGGWTISGGSTMHVLGAPNRFFNSGAIVNDGTVDWSGTGGLYFQGGATFTNNGLFDITSNMVIDNSSGAGTFINAATGTLHVASGNTVGIASGFVSNGGTMTADGTFNFNAGGQFNDGTSFDGAGVSSINGGGQFAGTINTGNLRFANGNFTGSGAMLNGTSEWTGGSFLGSWVNGSGSALAVSGNASRYLNGGTFANDGTMTLSGGNTIYLQGGHLFTNNGTVDMTVDGNFLLSSSGSGSAVNNGLIVKTGGTGTSRIALDLSFNNLGTVDAQTGTIQFANNFANNGTLTGDGTFRVDGATGLTNNGTIAAGDGIGTLDITGNLASTSFSVLEFELGSTLSFDQLFISGTAALDGMLSLFCTSCTMTAGDTFKIIDSIGNLSGTFAGFSTSGFLTGFDYDVIYDYDLDEVRLVVLDAGLPDDPPAAVPEPGTWAMMIGGFALAGGAMRRRRRAERVLVRFAA